MVSSKREHLVKVAQELFYQQGIRATGIDAILATSGVAKKTLYNHFPSKNELILATLKHRDDAFMLMLEEGVKKFIKPYQKAQTSNLKLAPILAFFDTLTHWFNSDHFNGCMFINVSAEYPTNTCSIHKACSQHKNIVIEFITSLLGEVTSNDNSELATQMAILADGAIVNAHTTNNLRAADQAKIIAETILTQHC